jgi:hypothetical protein
MRDDEVDAAFRAMARGYDNAVIARGGVVDVETLKTALREVLLAIATEHAVREVLREMENANEPRQP